MDLRDIFKVKSTDLMMEVSLVTVVKDDNRTRMPLTENGVTNQV